jgi:hypothetical protein
MKQSFQDTKGVAKSSESKNSSHFCASPKLSFGFPTSYVVVFFVFNDLLILVELLTITV